MLYRKVTLSWMEIEELLNCNRNIIKYHLNTVTNWNPLELALFMNCLFLFDTEDIPIAYKRTVKKRTFGKK